MTEPYDKEKNFKIDRYGPCFYHLCNKKNVKLFRCKHCGEYFCDEHINAKIPQVAPFKSTDVDRQIEWRKIGHPCLPYFYYSIEKEKESKDVILPKISKLEPIIDYIPEPKTPESEAEINIITGSENKPEISDWKKNEKQESEHTDLIKIKTKKRIKFANPVVALVIGIIFISILSVSGFLVLNQMYQDLKLETTNLEDELILTNNQLNYSNIYLDSIETELADYNLCLDENITILQSLRNGNKFNLHDPTYKEIIEFMDLDLSDELRELVNNAKNQGIRCSFVFIIMGDSELRIVGFNTIDEGMIYFEAETDYRVFPEIGKQYCACVEGSPYYSPTDYDDTITDILIMW